MGQDLEYFSNLTTGGRNSTISLGTTMRNGSSGNLNAIPPLRLAGLRCLSLLQNIQEFLLWRISEAIWAMSNFYNLLFPENAQLQPNWLGGYLLHCVQLWALRLSSGHHRCHPPEDLSAIEKVRIRANCYRKVSMIESRSWERWFGLRGWWMIICKRLVPLDDHLQVAGTSRWSFARARIARRII